MCVAECDDDTMWLALVYNTQVLEEELIMRLGQYYVRAFELMLEGLDEPHQATIAADGGRATPSVVWLNRTAADFPRDICLHELFEAQVERSPGVSGGGV